MRENMMDIVRKITGLQNDVERLKTVEMGGGLFVGEGGLYRYDTDNVSSHQLSNITTGDYNTVYGIGSGVSLTIGNYNTLIGYESGASIASAASCTIIGVYAGEYAEGDGNTFIGQYSGSNLQYGTGNIAIGLSAGRAHGTTGADADDNIFIGTWAGYKIDGGYQNIFIGLEAGYTCADDDNNVFIGSYSGKYNDGGSENTFVGAYAGNKNTTADYNTLIGTWAGYYNQTGANNTIVGYEAGNGVSGNSYSNSVFIGYHSGYSMTTGEGNVFLGYQSGYSETGSNKLYIENSNSTSPLIYGEFDNDIVKINGHLEVTEQIAITSSALLGTPVAGTIEFYDDRFWITNVATARPIDRTNDVITETFTLDGDAAVHGTTETTVWTGTLEANALKVGNVLKVILSGEISNANASSDLTIRKYIGSTLLEEFTPAIGNLTDDVWHIENMIVVRSVGASGVIAYHGHIDIGGYEETVNGIVSSIDTTAAEDITITMQWASADAANLCEVQIGMMEFKN